jgi:alanine racemase
MGENMVNLTGIRSVWAEINLDDLADNMREARRLANKTAVINAVVKADGYGHGAVCIAKTLLENGANSLSVAILDEAIELRRAGIMAPILVLGYTEPERAWELVEYNIEQTVFSYFSAQVLSRAAQKKADIINIHIKIDSGMGRIGFPPSQDTIDTILAICRLPNIKVQGIFTHFAEADALDSRFTENQYERFRLLCRQLEKNRIYIPTKHCANSAAIINFPAMHMDMVRAGIMLYSLSYSSDKHRRKTSLKQIMSLKTKVVQVKELQAGDSVGYGRTFTADKLTVVATLPIGYADGFNRLLSCERGEVLIKGMRVPVIGRICMDQSMIDVTKVKNINIGDEVVLFGAQGNEMINTDEIARKLNTINYEVVTSINKRVPRVYVKDGDIVDIHNYLLNCKMQGNGKNK